MNIYAYTRPETYLKEMLAAKKEKNPQFSLRAWARLLGMKTHTPLQLMLASKRPIPKKYIPLFGKSLSLSEEETAYLEAMIDHQRARTEKDKAASKTRMLAMQKRKLDELGVETDQPDPSQEVDPSALTASSDKADTRIVCN